VHNIKIFAVIDLYADESRSPIKYGWCVVRNSDDSYVNYVIIRKMSELTISKESIKRDPVFQLAQGESIKYSLLGSTIVGAGTIFLTLT